MGFGNVPTETVVDAVVARGAQRDGGDLANGPQRAQLDSGVANPMDVART
jgi:hypothetical protein